MSVLATLERGTAREPLSFGHVVIIGGGCYGSWYAQQLDRAIMRGALRVDRVTVVDRDPGCQVVRTRDRFRELPLEVVVDTWAAFLERWLASATVDSVQHDAIVPSPLMPHLLLDWLIARAQVRWPGRAVSVAPLQTPPPMPWERAAPDGRHYVSFAEWMCPVNCIEPARCPATRGARDWSMPPALSAYVTAEQARGHALRGPIIFHCLHRTWGVGMIDVSAVVAADALVATEAANGPARFLIGTVSHCHGALGVLQLD
jgi:hypothetical protein